MAPPAEQFSKFCLICLNNFKKTVRSDSEAVSEQSYDSHLLSPHIIHDSVPGGHGGGEADGNENENNTSPIPKSNYDIYTRFLHFSSRYLKLKSFTKPLLEDWKEYEGGEESHSQAFCDSCGVMVRNVCDLYTELQVVELHLVWKLSQLGGKLKGGKRSSVKFGKGLLKYVATQLNVKSIKRLEAFRNILEIKCSNKRKECAPRPVIPRGLFPERWNATFSATKAILLRLIVVFMLGSDSLLLQNGQKEHAGLKPDSNEGVQILKDIVKTEGEETGDVPEDLYWNEVEDIVDHAVSNDDADSSWSDTEFSTSDRARTRNPPNLRFNLRRKRDAKDTSFKHDPDDMEEDLDSSNEEDNDEWKLRNDSTDGKGSTKAKRAKRIRRVNDDRPKTVPCPKCSMRFINSNGLSGHLRAIHGSSISYSCKVCGLKFKRSNDLTRHKRTHRKDKVKSTSQDQKTRRIRDLGGPIKCTECSRGFPSFVSMKMHRKKMHKYVTLPRGRIQCPVCFHVESGEDEFRIHWLKHGIFNLQNSCHPTICKVCGKPCDKDESIEDHFQNAHQSTYLCYSCDAKHTSATLLMEHLETHETSEKPFQCDNCLQRYSTEQYFNIHRGLSHLNNGRLSCEVLECSESFDTVQEINHHLKLHVSGWPTRIKDEDGANAQSQTTAEILNCSTCNQGFISKLNRGIHELLHIPPSESKTGYSCPVCGHQTHFLETLISHYYKSHGEQEEGMCDRCDKSFFSTVVFKAHLRAHQEPLNDSGVKHNCTTCKLEFGDIFSLRLHKDTNDHHDQTLSGRSRFFTDGRPIHIARRVARPTARDISLTCKECGKMFDALRLLGEHLNTTHETNDWKPHHCWFCSDTFTTLQTRRVHRWLRHKILFFGCEYFDCGKTFRTVEELGEHLKSHLEPSNDKPPNSTECEPNEQNENPVNPVSAAAPSKDPPKPSDFDTTPVNKILKCSKCDWGFLRDDLLELHELTHTQLSTLKCIRCEEFFSSVKQLRFHYDNRHGKFLHRSYDCPECDLKLISKQAYMRHMARHDRRRGVDLACDQCSYRINDPIQFQKHVMAHDPANWFPCTVEGCGKSFPHRSGLWKHNNKDHGLGRKYSCPKCGMIFTDQDSAKQHMRNVHAERSIICDICGKGFKKYIAMKYHKDRVHVSDDKKEVYVCSECGKVYQSEPGLKFHIGSVHMSESEKRFGCSYCSKRYERRHLRDSHMVNCAKINGILNPDAAQGTDQQPSSSSQGNLEQPEHEQFQMRK